MDSLSRRGFLAGSIAVGTTAVLAACSPSAPTPTPAASRGPATGALKVWNFASQVAPAVDTSFRSAHPKLDLELTALGLADLNQALLVAVATATDVPDAVSLYIPVASDFAASNALAPMDDVLAPYIDQFPDSAIVRIGGTAYGYQISDGKWGTWVNNASLEAAGIDASELTTMDAQIDAAAKLAKDSDKLMFIVGNGTRGFASFAGLLNSLGGNIWSENGDLVEDQAASLRVLEFLAELQNKGLLYRGDWAEPSFYEEIKRGSLAGFNSNFAIGAVNIPKNAPDQSGQWRALTFPAWDEGTDATTGSGGGTSWAMMAGAANPDAAAEFATWWLDDEVGMESLVKAFGTVPYAPAQELPIAQQPYEYFGGQKLIADLSAQTLPRMNYFKWSRTEEIMSNAIEEMFAGTYEPEKALDLAMAELRAAA